MRRMEMSPSKVYLMNKYMYDLLAYLCCIYYPMFVVSLNIYISIGITLSAIQVIKYTDILSIYDTNIILVFHCFLYYIIYQYKRQNILLRKFVHISIGVIATFSNQQFVFYVSSFTLCMLFIMRHLQTQQYIPVIITGIEKYNTSMLFDVGIVYYIVSVLLNSLFPYNHAKLILYFADPFASIYGCRYEHKIKIINNKTLFGSIVFFVTAYSLVDNVLFAVILTLCELVSKDYDNLIIECCILSYLVITV